MSMEKRKAGLVIICLSILYLLIAQALLASSIPIRGRLKVLDPPGKGQVGRMVFFFRPKTNVDGVTVSFTLPEGCSEAGDALVRTIGSVPTGKLVRVSCRFRAEEMGIFRVSADAQAYDSSLHGGSNTWYDFFEAGPDRGYAPVVKPLNRWQKETTPEPSEDEFVEIRKNVYKSMTRVMAEEQISRVKKLRHWYEVDRFPVLPTVGDITGRLKLSAPPLLGKRVRLDYELTVNERLGRRNAPVEIAIIFPPNAFRYFETQWPRGGEYQLLERGFMWQGFMPPSGRLKISMELSAQVPGEGKIRALCKVRGRRGDLTAETPLFVQVNRHSARVMKSYEDIRGS